MPEFLCRFLTENLCVENFWPGVELIKEEFVAENFPNILEHCEKFLVKNSPAIIAHDSWTHQPHENVEWFFTLQPSETEIPELEKFLAIRAWVSYQEKRGKKKIELGDINRLLAFIEADKLKAGRKLAEKEVIAKAKDVFIATISEKEIIREAREFLLGSNPVVRKCDKVTPGEKREMILLRLT